MYFSNDVRRFFTNGATVHFMQLFVFMSVKFSLKTRLNIVSRNLLTCNMEGNVQFLSSVI